MYNQNMNMGGLIDLFPDIPDEQGEVVKLIVRIVLLAILSSTTSYLNPISGLSHFFFCGHTFFIF